MSTFLLLRESAPVLMAGMSAVLGAIIGSFLGVVTERLPGRVMEEEGADNLLFPASHCPCCQHPLAWWENIPLLSWCVLRGRCHACGSAIPVRLFLLELFTAMFFAVGAVIASSSSSLLAMWVMWSILLPLAAIDLRLMLLPDCLTQPLLWAGLLYHSVGSGLPLVDAVYGAVAGYLSLWLVYWAFRLTTGREGLGYGDFKLLAALGAWCGWQALPALLLIAAVSGIIFSCLLYRNIKSGSPIPFGPFLALAGMAIFISQTAKFIF